MPPESVQISSSVIQDLQKSFPLIQRTYGVKRIGIFGSFARGEEKPESDVDILVEFNPGEATFDNFMQLAYFLENIFSRHVDLLTCDGVSKYLRPYIEKEVIWYER
ncbi:MAG: nucleotidyltransferase family protein [Methanospirillum sp.]|uniref:nucleotidyltransferase family protein n=1 Tax=Methanospirillum sp. TaxID=45200 RepID=UPI00236D15CD|nr:nucleotidyltransferase family protein [Methanospirillum sp.]MDD1729162.1 nucleotidyltransferase family protein [Methanospirillum sp.]